MEPSHIIIAIVGSAIAGAINTLAGNGSAITLSILTELLGLPPDMANGTNRIGVFSQTVAASYAFKKSGKLNWQQGKLYILLTIIGAIFGVIVAIWISNEAFKQVFRFLMVFMLIVILVKPKRWLRETDTSNPPKLWFIVPAFLALGFYGGFIQMGMGIFFLAVTVLVAKFSLLDSNVLKSLIVAVYTFVVILIFQYHGLIDWKIGLIMAIGQTAGGYFTAIFASRYEQINWWAHRLLIVVVVLAIIKLFGGFDFLY